MKKEIKMKDPDIRPILFDYYDEQGGRQRIIEEFPLGRRTRADALLITDCLIGFEIKSDKDTLKRLERQIIGYHTYCDKNYIVSGTKYLEKVTDEVPANWGIIHVYRDEEGESRLEFIREAEQNPREHLRSQLHLLWRAELIDIIRKYRLGGVSGKNKQVLREMIYKGLSHEVVRRELCDTLIEREYSVEMTEEE